jgi:hypothetical protein
MFAVTLRAKILGYLFASALSADLVSEMKDIKVK